jgi:hypothetical protein
VRRNRSSLRTANLCRRTLYKNDGSIVELNRVSRLATRWLGKKISEILLRLVGLSDLGLQEGGQGVQYKHRQRAPVVPPTPDRHFADTEGAGSGGIAAKCDLEDVIMPAGGNPAVKTR